MASGKATGALTLKQLGRLVSGIVADPRLQGVWVTAELSDVRQSGGHCYMELLEKNPDTGAVEARMRGIIWASVFARLAAKFMASTGQRFATGLKVMVCGSVNYHASFGMSFVINDIDPAYTMGEAERLRREILTRLEREGVINLNRSLPWTEPSLRVAVISAAGAAGYGDFINQLYHNPHRLRFTTRLFPAVLQGDRTVPSVISALEEIAAESDLWDCVVIIRGGGATSDLASFDNYDLANNIAQFPLPVIVGIGHERDITVLDYVANMRVKTPTAAAEHLIRLGYEALDRLNVLCSDIAATASERVAGCKTQLAYLEGLLPVVPAAAMTRALGRMERCGASLAALAPGRLNPARASLDATVRALKVAAANAIARARQRIESTEHLVDALSPQATLRRGYSLTLAGGKTVRSIADVAPGAEFTTVLADGRFTAERKK